MDIDHVNEVITGQNGAFAGMALGAMAHIVTETTVTSVATHDIDIPAGVGLALLVIHEYRPATDSTSFLMRLSNDDGSTFEAASGDYQWSRMFNNVSNAFSGNSNLSTATSIVIADTAGNAAGENTSGVVLITGLRLSAVKTGVNSIITLGNQVGTLNPVVSAGRRTTAEDNDAIRLLSSSGNIATLTYSMYGILA